MGWYRNWFERASISFYLHESWDIPATGETSNSDNREDEDDDGDADNVYVRDLQTASKPELIQQIKTLQKELKDTKAELNNFKAIIKSLPEKRALLVEALSVIDILMPG